MVSLTLFFIGAVPMISVDSCPHYHLYPLAGKSTVTFYIPKPDMELLFTDADIWSLNKIDDDQDTETNDPGTPANHSMSVLPAENLPGDTLPGHTIPIRTPQNTHFFDKYLLNSPTDSHTSDIPCTQNA